MKASLPIEPLLAALKTATAVAIRSIKPILGCVRVDVDKSGWSTAATDMEVKVRTNSTQVIQVDEPGSFTVNAARFLKVMEGCKESAVVGLETQDNRVIIKVDKASFKLHTDDNEAFPSLFEDKDMEVVSVAKIDAASLLLALSQTIGAVDPKTSRLDMAGLHIQVGLSRLEIAGTDGRRLYATTTATVESKRDMHVIFKGKHNSAIVPTKGVDLMRKMLKGIDGHVFLSIYSTSVRLTLENETLDVQALERKFPDYHEIIPSRDKAVASLVVSRQELVAGLRKASLMTTPEYSGVALSVDHNATASSVDEGKGKAEVNIPNAAFNGHPMLAHVNPRFVLSAVNNLAEPQVGLYFYGEKKPILITGEDFKAVIMPMAAK